MAKSLYEVAGFLSTAALGRSKGIVNSEEWFYLILKDYRIWFFLGQIDSLGSY